MGPVVYAGETSSGSLFFMKGDEEMTWIKEDDVAGYQFKGGTVCTECATEEDLKDLTSDEIITAEGLSEHMVFCDRCKKQIEG